jgi:3D (Asp-Asp-Asp) domain-containing protein
MTRLPLTFLLAAAALTGCASHDCSKKAGTKMTVRTTAYTAAEPGGAHSATGELLHFGGSTNTYSAAADWSWMPLGTRFKMLSNGRTYVVEDYGSALVGKQTIDLFMPGGHEMNAWGCRQEQIQVLEWGSSALSLRLLAERQSHAHVRTMVAALQKEVKNGPLLAGPVNQN